MAKLVTKEEVQSYLNWHNRTFEMQPRTDKQLEQFVSMINYFSDGVATTLGNIMGEYHVHYTLEDGCRCGSCYEWRADDTETGVTKLRADSISGLVEKYDSMYNV